MALNKQFRSPHSPSPIYGIRPGFTVGDLESHRSWAANVVGIASTSSSVAAPAAISPKARVIKLVLNVTAGTGSVVLSVKSADDTYTATIFTSDSKSGVGTYDFYVGGWASPTDGDAGYKATQYGPVKAGSSPDSGDSTGDEDTTNPDPSADQNFIGGVYNPTNFISLAGSDIKLYSVVTGSITYSVDVVAVS